jgi:rubredoxin
MYSTGEAPGRGYYSCRKCGKVIYVNHDDNPLPPCPNCGDTKWDKLS